MEATTIQRGPSQATGSLGLILCQSLLSAYTLCPLNQLLCLHLQKGKRQLHSKDLEIRALWHIREGRVSETGAENRIIASHGRGPGLLEFLSSKQLGSHKLESYPFCWWHGTT